MLSASALVARLEMDLMAGLEATGLGLWVRESDYGYYVMLGGHALGMALVVGIVLMLNFRVLGYARMLPISAFAPLTTIAWLGFALNAATGVVLFMSNAQRLFINPAFWIKILLIVLGGLSVWLLMKTLDTVDAQDGREVTSRSSKVFSVFSIVFWTGAIAAGRLIAYTLAPPAAPTF
jgi:hypothetical protein